MRSCDDDVMVMILNHDITMTYTPLKFNIAPEKLPSQ